MKINQKNFSERSKISKFGRKKDKTTNYICTMWSNKYTIYQNLGF